ncbi:low specificity L-threonine aldolase [Labrys sp. KNU-23]|uniref:threonine aldolase family protein n=1 Tax=Labrys sp. KNU-23 TaxID=2789216 RepID=UPI0011EBF56D|nr:beta-eliminating lyase-related protein [Labrys sp. KNU-23]QEN88615.1 low specificity L-threonine aldolase [Labrys sp. KNU-23]
MNFASDNWAGASPMIIEALARGADGIAPAYGQDDLTRELKARLADLFGREVGVLFAATGSAANSLALSALSPPYGAVYAYEEAHIVGDEAGAPEFFTHGARLVPIAGAGGKLTPAGLEATLARGSGSGAAIPKPAVLSITQATESGTVYRRDEVSALTEIARARGLKVHMDGARFANAFAFLEKADGISPADITWKAGVDALAFGLTKNGALMAEAVLLFEPEKAAELEWLRKRSGHVVSKAWPIAAQFLAMLENDHWLDLARHANAMSSALSQGLVAAGHRLGYETEANEVFAILPKTVIARVREAGARLYEWPVHGLPADRRPAADADLVRLVTSFATKSEEVERFLKLVG